MPKNMTDSPVWATTVQGIQDGDLLDSAHLSDIGIQDLANRTAHLRLPATSSSDKYPLASRSITRVMAANPAAFPAADWQQSVGGAFQKSVSGGQLLIYPIDVPDGATITAIEICVDGTVTHSVPLETPPGLTLCSIAHVSGDTTSSDTKSDVQEYPEDYDDRHVLRLNLASAPVTVNKSTHRYVALVTGETDTGAQLNTLFSELSVTFTTAEQDPGAA